MPEVKMYPPRNEHDLEDAKSCETCYHYTPTLEKCDKHDIDTFTHKTCRDWRHDA